MPCPERMDPLAGAPQRAFRARSGHLLGVGLVSVARVGSTAACGTDPPPSPPQAASPSTASTAPPSETVDELVRVGEGRLHVRCVGAGATTVLLIAGFNDGGDNWGDIEAALARQVRVCSSARFGTGASDPPTRTQTFATSAQDLHALLAEIGQEGPYVVVGHSYGGGQAVTFASRYRTEVDGLVLLDALPLLVVTAADHPFPGLEPAATARLNEVWDDGQEGWLSLSSDAHLRSVDGTSHYIQLDRPDVVLSEIRGLLP